MGAFRADVAHSAGTAGMGTEDVRPPSDGDVAGPVGALCDRTKRLDDVVGYYDPSDGNRRFKPSRPDQSHVLLHLQPSLPCGHKSEYPGVLVRLRIRRHDARPSDIEADENLPDCLFA